MLHRWTTAARRHVRAMCDKIPSAGASSGGGGGGAAAARPSLWGRYLEMLERRPLATKVATSVVITATGDVICQTVVEGGDKPFSPRRLVNMAVLGGVLVGPGLHWWYGQLGRRFPGNAWPDVLKRLACDQLLWAPAFIAAFFVGIGVVQGTPEEIVPRLRNSWLDAVLNNYKLWPAAQIINFRFVPVQHQVLFSNFVAVIWNTYISWESNRVIPPAQCEVEDVADSPAKQA